MRLRSDTAKLAAVAAKDAMDDRCHLLELPFELQLTIYKPVIAENEILLINVPCNSSYRRPKYGHYNDRLDKDEKAWKSGEKRAPKQPAITRVNRFIRNETLPLFYGMNVFRARYCTLFAPDAQSGFFRWLRAIGPKNREQLKHFYFYDRNSTQDEDYPNTLEFLRSSEIFTEMGGELETLSDSECCVHRATFGEKARRAMALPLSSGLGTKVLKLDGEN